MCSCPVRGSATSRAVCGGAVNFTGDVVYYAMAILWDPQDFGSTMDYDLDKNGVLNFTGDVVEEAKRAIGIVDCLQGQRGRSAA